MMATMMGTHYGSSIGNNFRDNHHYTFRTSSKSLFLITSLKED